MVDNCSSSLQTITAIVPFDSRGFIPTEEAETAALIDDLSMIAPYANIKQFYGKRLELSNCSPNALCASYLNLKHYIWTRFLMTMTLLWSIILLNGITEDDIISFAEYLSSIQELDMHSALKLNEIIVLTGGSVSGMMAKSEQIIVKIRYNNRDDNRYYHYPYMNISSKKKLRERRYNVFGGKFISRDNQLALLLPHQYIINRLGGDLKALVYLRVTFATGEGSCFSINDFDSNMISGQENGAICFEVVCQALKTLPCIILTSTKSANYAKNQSICSYYRLLRWQKKNQKKEFQYYAKRNK
jgi:hypothetical protein